MGSIRRINGKVTKEYQAWKAMKARCYAPSANIGNYKLNNVQVCERWINNFENFLEDMGKCPENYSLDRINNNENYSLENCRWTDNTTQTSNRGEFNKIFTYNNESKTLKQWSKELNIKYTSLWTRIYRDNLTFEEAIQKDPFNKLIEYKGEKKLIKDWCLILGFKPQTIYDRRVAGWTIEECFETPVKKFKI